MYQYQELTPLWVFEGTGASRKMVERVKKDDVRVVGRKS
jgi:hypothetical protein